MATSVDIHIKGTCLRYVNDGKRVHSERTKNVNLKILDLGYTNASQNSYKDLDECLNALKYRCNETNQDSNRYLIQQRILSGKIKYHVMPNPEYPDYDGDYILEDNNIEDDKPSRWIPI